MIRKKKRRIGPGLKAFRTFKKKINHLGLMSVAMHEDLSGLEDRIRRYEKTGIKTLPSHST